MDLFRLYWRAVSSLRRRGLLVNQASGYKTRMERYTAVQCADRCARNISADSSHAAASKTSPQVTEERIHCASSGRDQSVSDLEMDRQDCLSSSGSSTPRPVCQSSKWLQNAHGMVSARECADRLIQSRNRPGRHGSEPQGDIRSLHRQRTSDRLGQERVPVVLVTELRQERE